MGHLGFHRPLSPGSEGVSRGPNRVSGLGSTAVSRRPKGVSGLGSDDLGFRVWEFRKIGDPNIVP